MSLAGRCRPAAAAQLQLGPAEPGPRLWRRMGDGASVVRMYVDKTVLSIRTEHSPLAPLELRIARGPGGGASILHSMNTEYHPLEHKAPS